MLKKINICKCLLFFNVSLLCGFVHAQTIQNVAPDYVSYGSFINFTIHGEATNFSNGVTSIKIINRSTGFEIPEYAGKVNYNVVNDTVITGVVFPTCIYNDIDAAYQVNSTFDGSLFFDITAYGLSASKDPIIHNSCFESNDGAVKVFGAQSPAKESLTFEWLRNGAPYFSELVDSAGFSELNTLPQGDYTIHIKKGACEVSTSAMVNQPAEKFIAVQPITDTAYCFSNLPAFTINSSIAGPFDFTYSVNGNVYETFMGNGETSYDVFSEPFALGTNTIGIDSALDATGCPMTIISPSFNFTIYPEPDMNFIGGETICEGDSTKLYARFFGDGPFDLTYTDGISEFTINNVSEDTLIDIVPASTRTYSVVSFNNQSNPGCSGISSATVEVVVNPIPAANLSISGPNPICAGDETQLQFSLVAGDNLSIVVGTDNSSINYFNIQDGEEKTIFPTSTQTFFIKSIVDQEESGCSSGPQGDTVTVEVGGPQFAELSVTENYCLGDTISVKFNLPGLGPFNIYYSDGINSYTDFSVTDGYSTEYIVTGITTLSLDSVIDIGLGCSGETSSFVNIDPLALPNPILFGTIKGCFGDTLRAPGSVNSGTGPFSIHYSYHNRSFNDTVPVSDFFLFANPDSSGYLVVNEIIDTKTGCRSNLSDSLFMEITPHAEAGTGVFDRVCGNKLYNLFDALNPPFDTTGAWTELEQNFAVLGNFLDPEKLPFGTFNYQYKVPGQNGCKSDSTLISIEHLPDFNIVNLTTSCDSDNLGYIVEFDIEGNGATDFSVSGSASGTLNPSPPQHFKSVSIPNNTPFTFTISNNLGCEQTISGNKNCFCANFAGVLLPDQDQYCQSETAQAFIAESATKNTQDSLLYVVKQSASPDTFDFLLINDVPAFNYNPILNFDETYYLACVVAPVLNDTLQLTDTCVSISNLIPFVFKAENQSINGSTKLNGSNLSNGNAFLYDAAIAKNYNLIDQSNLASSRFLFDDLVDGQYLIEVVPNASIYPNALPLYVGDAATWEEATLINKSCFSFVGDLTTRITTLPPTSGPGNLSGFVFNYSPSGSSPRANQRVLLIDSLSNEVVTFTKSNASGFYSLNNIPEGNYRLKVEIAGLPHISTYNVNISASSGSSTELNFDVEQGFGIFKSGTVGVSSIDEQQLVVYPNPATSVIQINGVQLSSALRLIDLTGKVWQESDLIPGKNTLMVQPDIPQGVYLIQINNRIQQKTLRLTILR